MKRLYIMLLIVALFLSSAFILTPYASAHNPQSSAAHHRRVCESKVKHCPSWWQLNADLHKSARWAADVWDVSYDWIHNCAHGEGGHSVDIRIRGAAGEYYWWQYLWGTWEWMSNEAWKTARQLKMERPPLDYKRVSSPLGQAFTTAWAFSHGLSYHWFGRGC